MTTTQTTPTPALPTPTAPTSAASTSPAPHGSATVPARPTIVPALRTTVPAAATVGVLGLGRLGLQLARALATAGVGHLVLDDPGVVRAEDLGVSGYRLGDVGRPRDLAAARSLGDWAATTTSRVRTSALENAPDRPLTMLVVITHEPLDPSLTWRLMAEDVPHLTVTWWPGRVDVGPGVVPGRTPCLRCVDLHRADERAAPARGRLVTSGDEHPVLAVAGAALAAARILAHLGRDDDRRHGGSALAAAAAAPVAPGGSPRRTAPFARTTSLTLPDLAQHDEFWPVHPACGCHDLSS